MGCVSWRIPQSNVSTFLFFFFFFFVSAAVAFTDLLSHCLCAAWNAWFNRGISLILLENQSEILLWPRGSRYVQVLFAQIEEVLGSTLMGGELPVREANEFLWNKQTSDRQVMVWTNKSLLETNLSGSADSLLDHISFGRVQHQQHVILTDRKSLITQIPTYNSIIVCPRLRADGRLCSCKHW